MDPLHDFPRGHPNAPAKHAPLGTAAWSASGPAWVEGFIWLGRDGDGKAIGHSDDRHMVTVAGSRAGKGRSAIIPNLFLWPGSCVVVDPKGENAGVTAAARARRPGHAVVVLDPFGEADVDADLRASFNPLNLVEASRDDAIDLTSAIGDALMVSGSDKDVHWDESGRQVIEAIILHVAASDRPDRRSLVRVRQLLTLGDVEFAAFLTEKNRAQARDVAVETALAAGASEDEAAQAGEDAAGKVKPVGPFAALWWKMSQSDAANEAVRDVIAGAANSLLEMGENERGSVLSTARRNTKFIDSPPVRASLQGRGFEIDRLKAAPGGVSLYVCLPARFIPTHARFLRLVVNLVIYRMEAMGREPPASGRSVLFVMDEFAALGRLEAIEKAAGLMAGYGVKLWPILQDLGQIKRHYRESWETFLGNAGVLQFFANTDLTTLEWLSKRMGQTEIVRETEGRSTSETSGRSLSESQSKSEGGSRGVGTTEGVSIMPELQSAATRDGGGTLFGLMKRTGASDAGVSKGSSYQEGESWGTSTQEGQGSSSGTSKSESVTEGLHVAALMNPDEIARHFDRATELQIVFIGGGAPAALRRTPYDQDAAFKAFSAAG